MKIPNDDLPIGFAMGLAQNTPALERFSQMNDTERAAEIEKAKKASSKNEMRSIVDDIAKRENQG